MGVRRLAGVGEGKAEEAEELKRCGRVACEPAACVACVGGRRGLVV
jgi:hypothetical protein